MCFYYSKCSFNNAFHGGGTALPGCLLNHKKYEPSIERKKGGAFT